jgi:hypothetical protein
MLVASARESSSEMMTSSSPVRTSVGTVIEASCGVESGRSRRRFTARAMPAGVLDPISPRTVAATSGRDDCVVRPSSLGIISSATPPAPRDSTTLSIPSLPALA